MSTKQKTADWRDAEAEARLGVRSDSDASRTSPTSKEPQGTSGWITDLARAAEQSLQHTRPSPHSNQHGYLRDAGGRRTTPAGDDRDHPQTNARHRAQPGVGPRHPARVDLHHPVLRQQPAQPGSGARSGVDGFFFTARGSSTWAPRFRHVEEVPGCAAAARSRKPHAGRRR